MSTNDLGMTSVRPFLVKAYYDWIVENHLTPFLHINAKCNYVEVPEQFVERGQIVLNVAPMAVEALRFGKHGISFRARFGALIEDIYIPTPAIMAVYAKENAQGIYFDEPDEAPPRPRESVPGLINDPKKRSNVSHLKIIKSDVKKDPQEDKGEDDAH